FFQAEDGIRDWSVTGVQTCALPISFAVDITPDRSMTAIAVCGTLPGGKWLAQVADHRAGTTWAVDRLAGMAQEHRPCAVVLDKRAPAGPLLDDPTPAPGHVTRPTPGGVLQTRRRFS